MKNWNWKQWTAFGLSVAVLVTAFILHLVQPTVSFAFTEIVSVVTFVIGVVSGYLFKQDKKETEETKE